MCGICGYAGFEPDTQRLAAMNRALAHRGPDGSGSYVSGSIGLAMSRLSIIDVEGGQQPIQNEDGRIHIVCNGEIYNHQELRRDLLAKGHRFRTASDAEVIVHLYEDLGLECLNRLRGMFAFAIYDQAQNRLFVGRDRIGIKPLYYWRQGDRLLIASELKALLTCPEVDRQIDAHAVDAYLTYRYVPGPETMFPAVRKLPAGHLLTWSSGALDIRSYWTPGAHSSGPEHSDRDYVDGFERLFSETIDQHMMSDVPLGAYLSGGVDSTSVVAAMAKVSTSPVKTFTVGFGDANDELRAAAATARRLGCEHTEIICSAADLEHLPSIMWHCDEPLGDAIVVPTYLLAREAAKHVRVVLTGEGADELLAGYVFHRALQATARYRSIVPQSLHDRVLVPLARRTPSALLNPFFDYPGTLGNQGKARLVDFATGLHQRSLSDAYRSLITLFDPVDRKQLFTAQYAEQIAIGRQRRADEGQQESDWGLDRSLRLQYRDWLPDNILQRQDRMSMAHGLEARVPFLDHRLVEFLERVPARLKLRGSSNKWLLRQYTERLLPNGPAFQRKRAFYMPMENFLGHAVFRDWIHDTLSPERVRRRGMFNPAAVASLVQSVDRGDFLTVKRVVALVLLEIWQRTLVDGQRAGSAA